MGIATSAGEREFDTIVATHEKALNGVVSPCGNCRQMLFEYCPDIKVIVNDENGNLIEHPHWFELAKQKWNYIYKTTGTPCSCWMCKGESYNRREYKKETRRVIKESLE